MNKLILVLIIILSLTSICFAQLNSTDTFIITTYYPAPHGVYGTMRLYPLEHPKVACSQSFEGAMYYNNSADNIEVCKCDTSGACAYSTVGGGGWTESGNNLYNTNSGNVGIGTTGPAQKLEVNGTVKTTDVCSSAGCLNALYQIVNTAVNPQLYGSTGHTGNSCTQAGGNTVNVGSGVYICKFTAGTCPSGWTPYGWTTTAPVTYGFCCGACTTGWHSWAGSGAESCSWTYCPGGVCSCCDYARGNRQGLATITEIGCY